MIHVHRALPTEAESSTNWWPFFVVLGLVVLVAVVLVALQGRLPGRRRSTAPPADLADSQAARPVTRPVSQPVLESVPDPGPLSVAEPAPEPVPPPEAGTDASGIFISYRRQDEPNFAGRLYDRLAARYGRETVFMDVDTIDLGVDFAEVIDQSLARCQVMIVVIGREWLGVVDEDGERRLDNPDDYVRLEIEKALHSSTRVIPVLVEGATTPKSTQLPPPLASLSRRNGIAMAHASFTSDASRLIETLDRILAEPR